MKNRVFVFVWLTFFYTSYATQNPRSLSDSDLRLVPVDPATVPEDMRPFVVNQYLDPDGMRVDEVVVPGSPPPVRLQSVPVEILPLSAVMLSGVPAFNWTYGCSATAAGMLCGYYDRTGYPNMYTGSVNGGLCPLNNSGWGGSAECSFVASHQGVDGRTTFGHVDDFWSGSGNTGDPYYGNWTPHCQPGGGDCLADFMGTSQYYPANLQNEDGATTWTYYTAGNPYVGASFGKGSYGIRLFIEHRGYRLLSYYNQYIFGYNGNTQGFTFQQFMDEIDAGRPVILQVTGHSMLGVGYDEITETVYLHNTWNYNQYSMTWGGTYEGMSHKGVSVFVLADTSDTGPANDNFVDAILIAGLNGSVNGSNENATVEPGEPNHWNSSFHSVWWRWTAPASGSVVFDTNGSSFDTTLAAYTGSAVNSLSLVAKNDDSVYGRQSKIEFHAVRGTVYGIAVDGYGSSDYGTVTLNWRQTPDQSQDGPENDHFESATPISGSSGSVTGSNVDATIEAGEPSHAGESSAVNSIWWRWTAPASGEVVFDTRGSTVDTVLAVYTGSSVGSLVERASNDDAYGTASRVSMLATANSIYNIAVAGFGGAEGDITLNWGFFVLNAPVILGSEIVSYSGSQYLRVRFKVKSGNTYTLKTKVALPDSSWLNTSPARVFSASSNGEYHFDVPIGSSDSRFFKVTEE